MEALIQLSPFSTWQTISLIAVFALFSISAVTGFICGFWDSISPKARGPIQDLLTWAFLIAISCAYLGFTTAATFSLNIVVGKELATNYWLIFTSVGGTLTYSELIAPTKSARRATSHRKIVSLISKMAVFVVCFGIAIVSFANLAPR